MAANFPARQETSWPNPGGETPALHVRRDARLYKLGACAARHPDHSLTRHGQAHDFARHTFDADLEGSAANFAIGGEALRGDAGVDDQLAGLSTERTGGCLGNFHLHGTMNRMALRANRIISQSRDALGRRGICS